MIKIFNADQAKFIADGLGINLPAEQEVEITKEMAHKIYDFAVDEEVSAILEAGYDNPVSEYGEIATSIVNLFSAKPQVGQ